MVVRLCVAFVFAGLVTLAASAPIETKTLLTTGNPACSTFTDCKSCTSGSTWFPGSNCRWCPKESMCHSEGSMYNTCKNSENIYDPSKCSGTPAPSPPPPAPAASSFAEKTVAELFKLLKITDVDPSTCVSDVGRADVLFRDFAKDVASSNVTQAVSSLARGLSALTSSISGCGVTEVQNKIDLLAASIHWANISTAGFDKDVKVIVGASDLWKDIVTLGTAVGKEDYSAVGSAIGTLLNDWSTIVGGCGSAAKECKFLDGLLKLVQAVAVEVTPCETALSPALTELENATSLFKAKQYQPAVAQFAKGLDTVAIAIGSDACGLKKIASVIEQVVPKLANATVKVEASEEVKIIVGSAEVFDELYKATQDIINGDAAGFGEQMGSLLNKLKTSGCSTKACVILEGLLASLQLEGTDFTACAPDLDNAWTAIPTAMRDFEEGTTAGLLNGMKQMGTFLTQSAEAVGNCGIPDLGNILADTATKLGDKGIATEIGDVVQVLVKGSDVTLDLSKLITDAKAGSWSSVGSDLGTLSTWLQSTGCTTFVCKLTEGLLDAAKIPLQDLKACMKDLSSAEQTLVAGASAIASKQYEDGIKMWGQGINDIASSVKDCGIASELSFMQQEANVLGFGNVTILGEVASIMVHGSDLYPEIYSAFQAFASHDYRTAGADIGKVMNDLSQWTSGHSCSSDFCYVVTGIMQYMGDIQGDVKSCSADFNDGFQNFTAAWGHFHGGSVGGGDFHFNTDTKAIHQGIKDLGYGLEDISKGVGDCHLAELAELLSKLAIKLGVVPEIGWIEEVLHIVIEGVHIEQDLGVALVDYGNKNWVGFGYNLAKLIKTLV